MAERVVRSYRRIPEPGYPNATQEDVWDAYLHFFQDAYHLKDWIVCDESVGVDPKEMNRFIDGNQNMKLLQAIVTKAKHFRADHDHIAFREINLAWDDGGLKPSPEIGYEEAGDLLTEDGDHLLTEDGEKILLEAESKRMHPRRLTVKVLIAWNQFFKEHGLEGGFQVTQI